MKLLSLLIFSTYLLSGSGKPEQKIVPASDITTVLSSKEQAFWVLQSKCNVCHVQRNKRMVFTLENMDGFSLKINQQVFIKHRMPKGDEIRLSEGDRSKLKNWIDNLM